MASTKVLFHQMNLDERIIKSIASLRWSSPTLIQEKAIPLCLEGRDILARAKTGSGKTASYAIPCIQKILDSKRNNNNDEASVKVIVLVPTKELGLQAAKNLKELCSFCSKEVSIVGISNTMNVSSQRTALLEKPDIVVGTPSRILTHLQTGTLDLRQSLQLIVVDEADLVFSFGYEDDIKSITSHLPSVYQSILMSATLSEDVLSLKKLILNNPVILKLEDGDLPEQSRLTQFYIKCADDDRYLLIYTLLKLRLVRGKTLLFVNDIKKSYKLKLFLEQFSIKACVLNSELPHNSRCHVIEQFNKGLYDYVIATDELPDSAPINGNPLEGKSGRVAGKKRKRKDTEYGVSRGIDFQCVENVINFDYPPTTDSYIHRVGRTARGFDYGTALTFVSPQQENLLKELENNLIERSGDEEVAVKPYRFKMSEIEGFRYRVQDALRKVSQLAIREARLKEIRSEMLASDKLKNHFEENPRDLQVLRHDKVLLPQKVQQHLKYIPPYLVPKVIRTAGVPAEENTKVDNRHGRSFRKEGYRDGLKKKTVKHFRKNDPLKTLKIQSTTTKRKKKSR